MRNGDMVKAIVTEITSTEVKYKKASNPNGPLYTTPKSDILSILYVNGDVDKFTELPIVSSSEKSLSDQQPAIKYAQPNNDNQEIINSYNNFTPYRKKKSPTSKKTDDLYIYWGLTPQSIISTSEIEIEIKLATEKETSESIFNAEWMILIKNKTELPIYIDLANVFITEHGGKNDGEGNSWYVSTAFNKSTGSGKGASFGLGAITNSLGIGGAIGTIANGIGIGGGTSQNVSETKQMDRILIIPPYSKKSLPPEYFTVDKEIKSFHKTFRTHLTTQEKNKLNPTKWRIDTFEYSEAPFGFSIFINYSNQSDFSNLKIAPIHLYSRAIYGVPFWGRDTNFFDGSTKDFIKNLPDHFIFSRSYYVK